MSVTITYPDGRSFAYRVGSRRARGRLTASQLKSLNDRRSLTLNATAQGSPIPVVYGRTTVPGRIFAIGDISGDLVLGVVWCFGEIEEVEKVYINDEAVPGGVTQTDYTGTTTQTADSTLSSGVAAFADPMILETPSGDIGLAYSVFRIPSGQLDAAPTFTAVIKGRKVYDERDASTAYSNNPALCLADLASNTIFGLGATVSGAGDCADYCEEIVDSVERAQIGIVLSSPRSTPDYMDLLADYAECVWFNDGAGVTLKPDKVIGADNPCGQDVVDATETETTFSLLLESGDKILMESGDVLLGEETLNEWTEGDGWSYSGGVASSDGSQSAASSLSQTLTTEDGVKYAISITVSAYTAGSVSVDFDGVEVIAGKSATGTYTVLVTASGTSNNLEVVANADFVGDVEDITCKRLYLLEDSVVAGSLQITGLDDADSPTKVYCRYTEPQSSSGAWPDLLTSAARPGYDTGDIPAVETTLDYPGVQRVEEATNKANAKLQRMINRVEVSWITTDTGIIYQVADVVQVKNINRGADILAWVKSVEMVDYGRYRVTGMRYDEAHYPTEITLPENAGTVPVGAIVPYEGTLPSGWADYTDADGHFIMGAGGTYAVGDTGGSASFAGWSGNTTSVDSHDGASYNDYQGTRYNRDITDGTFRTNLIRPGDPPDLTHSHSFTIGSFNPDPLRRDFKLMQKTGSSSTVFPAVARVLGLDGLAAPGLSRLTENAGRLLAAASSGGNAGSANKFVSVTTGSYDDSHDHYDRVSDFEFEDIYSNDTVYGKLTAGGPHTHSFTLSVTRSVKRRRIALYGASGDFGVVPGTIVLWAGSLASLPTDWALCDGSGATPDLTDHFIEIAATGNEETAAGNNTVSVNGSGSSVGHQHRGTSGVSTERKGAYDHENTISHTHQISESSSWTPPYYALAAIMYSP